MTAPGPVVGAGSQPLGWGFVATGGIARTVGADLRLLGADRLVAASSRDARRAQLFADEFGDGSATGYGSVEELVADPRVDVVYVATPHAQHLGPARAALEAGKAVLCEKAMTLTPADTAALVAVAREQGVFLMEAVWMRFNPLVTRLRTLVADGAIGDVRLVSAAFGFVSQYDAASRMWDPALGGGSLLDLGIYPVNFVQMLLGSPESVEASGALSPDGVDAEASLLLRYPGGTSALVASSLLAPLSVTASVAGTAGRVDVDEQFHTPTSMTLRREGADPETFRVELEGNGYVPQLRHVEECVRAGATESAVMPLDDSVTVASILQQALDALGVSYPGA